MVRIFMEHSENIYIFNILGTLFGNIPWNLMGNFFRKFREYIMGIFHEYSMNIYLPAEEATDIHDKEIPKAGYYHTCLTVITIDSVF